MSQAEHLRVLRLEERVRVIEEWVKAFETPQAKPAPDAPADKARRGS